MFTLFGIALQIILYTSFEIKKMLQSFIRRQLLLIYYHLLRLPTAGYLVLVDEDFSMKNIYKCLQIIIPFGLVSAFVSNVKL